MSTSLAVIILTYNEEKNIEKCLKSIADLANEVFLVDSFSSDRSVEIAQKYGATVVSHEFVNQADQFNWALDNLDIKSDWILKLDADEELTPRLREEIKSVLPNTSSAVSGYYIKRRVYFMHQWIRHGGYYPIWFLRLWRKGKGRSEIRSMDEHIILSDGKAEKLRNDFIDDNKKGIKDWIQKHKNYALREAQEVRAGNLGEGGKRKLYYSLPPFLRVLLYFIYRYFIKFGFLDGIRGSIFHILHGLWYRFLVDWNIIRSKYMYGKI